MRMNAFAISLLISIGTLCAAGCSQDKPNSEMTAFAPREGVASDLQRGSSGGERSTWAALQRVAAAALEKESEDERWHIEPVNDPVPAIGDILDGTVTTKACELGATLEFQFAAFSVTQADQADLQTPIPSDWMSALRTDGGFVAGRRLELAYSRLKARSITSTPLWKQVPMCLEQVGALGGQRVRLVRGVITGRMTAVYGNDVAPPARMNVLERDGMRLSYLRNEGFKFEDIEDRVQFQIVAYVKAELILRTPITAVEEARHREGGGGLTGNFEGEAGAILCSSDFYTAKYLAEVSERLEPEQTNRESVEKLRKYDTVVVTRRDHDFLMYGVHVD